MLTALHIENIAVVEKTDILFDNGFNVLTGETGAGKSIVIDAISAVLGERTSHDLIRTGADSAVVTAVFEDISDVTIKTLDELGFSCEDGTLMIMRKIFSDGKNSIRINGMLSTVSVLKQIGNTLVDIHGQHDSQKLLDPLRQIEYIDAICDNHDLIGIYKRALSEYKACNKAFIEMQNISCEREQRIDYLRYAVDELSAAQIEIGEREELIRQRDLIRNSAEVVSQLSLAYKMLKGDEYSQDVSSALINAANVLMSTAEYLPQSKEIAEQLMNFGYETDELCTVIDNQLSKTEFDPNLLENIEARLDYLFRLSKKYGQTEEDMLSYLEQASEELQTLDNYEQQLSDLAVKVNEKLEILVKAATDLTNSRLSASEAFAQAVCEQLELLDMPKAKLEVNITKTDFMANGCDNIEFFISANAGETLKPLTKIASGGELSRIMLAIKTVLTDKDDVQTLIFDEIDSGISGSAARKVGLKIRYISSSRQVICVTHLAQIASLADVHFKITKRTDDTHTFTDVKKLDYDGRVEEVARIMSTGVMTDALRASASELINQIQ